MTMTMMKKKMRKNRVFDPVKASAIHEILTQPTVLSRTHSIGALDIGHCPPDDKHWTLDIAY